MFRGKKKEFFEKGTLQVIRFLARQIKVWIQTRSSERSQEPSVRLALRPGRAPAPLSSRHLRHTWKPTSNSEPEQLRHSATSPQTREREPFILAARDGRRVRERICHRRRTRLSWVLKKFSRRRANRRKASWMEGQARIKARGQEGTGGSRRSGGKSL